jgi:hypothetical protein
VADSEAMHDVHGDVVEVSAVHEHVPVGVDHRGQHAHDAHGRAHVLPQAAHLMHLHVGSREVGAHTEERQPEVLYLLRSVEKRLLKVLYASFLLGFSSFQNSNFKIECRAISACIRMHLCYTFGLLDLRLILVRMSGMHSIHVKDFTGALWALSRG